MKIFALKQIADMAYSSVLRPLLVKAIDDPENDWDDVVLDVVDRIFGYEK